MRYRQLADDLDTERYALIHTHGASRDDRRGLFERLNKEGIGKIAKESERVERLNIDLDDLLQRARGGRIVPRHVQTMLEMRRAAIKDLRRAAIETRKLCDRILNEVPQTIAAADDETVDRSGPLMSEVGER